MLRINPLINQVTGVPLSVGRGAFLLAVGERAVWVINVGDETVSRIELR